MGEDGQNVSESVFHLVSTIPHIGVLLVGSAPWAGIGLKFQFGSIVGAVRHIEFNRKWIF